MQDASRAPLTWAQHDRLTLEVLRNGVRRSGHYSLTVITNLCVIATLALFRFPASPAYSRLQYLASVLGLVLAFLLARSTSGFVVRLLFRKVSRVDAKASESLFASTGGHDIPAWSALGATVIVEMLLRYVLGPLPIVFRIGVTIALTNAFAVAMAAAFADMCFGCLWGRSRSR
jgi:hypothetical protein